MRCRRRATSAWKAWVWPALVADDGAASARASDVAVKGSPLSFRIGVPAARAGAHIADRKRDFKTRGPARSAAPDIKKGPGERGSAPVLCRSNLCRDGPVRFDLPGGWGADEIRKAEKLGPSRRRGEPSSRSLARVRPDFGKIVNALNCFVNALGQSDRPAAAGARRPLPSDMLRAIILWKEAR